MQRRSPLTTASLCVGFVIPLLVVLGSFTARSAAGQILWEGNGHYYLVVEEELSWEDARSRAESMIFMGVQGHLATITSEAENMFVTTQLGDTAGAWLGGEQLPDSEEPAGGWQWITGEPWVYTNWDPETGEPNNTYGGGWGKDATGQSEERLHYHHNGTHWNDLPDDPEVVTPRFIVEWDVLVDTDCVEPPAGLVSWWPGDGNADDIQNGNDGTLQNGATVTQGLVGQAFSLDGIDDFVNVGNAPTLHVSAGNFTVDAWVKFDVEGVFPDIDDMSIADKMNSEGINQNGWRLMRQRDHGHFWFCFGGGELNGCDFNEDRTGTNATSVRSTTVARKNVWYHIVGVLSSDQIAIYVNGIREGEKARPLFTDTHAADLLIGANAAEGAHVDGLVDEVEIYNRALSAAEVQAIFNAGRAGKCKETGPCTLNLAASMIEETLTLDFQLGTQEPATWNVWLTAQNEITRLLSIPLSVIDPPVRVPFTIPFVPPLGTVGILTTLTTSDRGIICSDFETVETGPISEDAASSVQELQDMLLQHFVK